VYFCVVLCIVCFVLFSVLFVCKYLLNDYHWVATQLHLNISYHIYLIATHTAVVHLCVCSHSVFRILHLLTAGVNHNWQHRKSGVREGMNEDIQCTYDVTLSAFVQPLLQWKSNTRYIFWVVFVAFGIPSMQCKCTILSSVACPALQNFSTFSHNRQDFQKKKLLDAKCVCWTQSVFVELLHNFCSKHFSFKEELSEIWLTL